MQTMYSFGIRSNLIISYFIVYATNKTSFIPMYRLGTDNVENENELCLLVARII